MADKNKKVVNTEEQNRAVNPGDRSYEKPAEPIEKKEETVNTSTDENPAEIEKPDQGREIGTPHRIEGDDASDIERKIPDL